MGELISYGVPEFPDDPDAVPARVQIQFAERIGWMKDAHTLPGFERYPPQG